MSHHIFIAGAGGIGRAAALMILESPHLQAKVTLGDADPQALQSAMTWIQAGTVAHRDLESYQMPRGADESIDGALLDQCDVLLDCLPGALAPTMAQYCLDHSMHYANLTEYVDETEQIMKMADGAETAFILQTGLAPGYIDVLGMQLVKQFRARHGDGKINHLRLRVGALSQNARSPHYYSFTWSPIGVATEYVKKSVILSDGKVERIPSLSEREDLILNGISYEADYTSGGIADLPEALADDVKNINYKTIRYPGHYDWVKTRIEGTSQADIDRLEDDMLANIPTVENDVVIVYGELEGKDAQGRLHGINETITVMPRRVGDHVLRAIQTTTAAPLIACAALLLEGDMKGLVTQSQLDSKAFLSHPIVSDIYGDLDLV